MKTSISGILTSLSLALTPSTVLAHNIGQAVDTKPRVEVFNDAEYLCQWDNRNHIIRRDYLNGYKLDRERIEVVSNNTTIPELEHHLYRAGNQVGVIETFMKEIGDPRSTFKQTGSIHELCKPISRETNQSA